MPHTSSQQEALHHRQSHEPPSTSTNEADHTSSNTPVEIGSQSRLLQASADEAKVDEEHEPAGQAERTDTAGRDRGIHTRPARERAPEAAR